MQRPASIQTGFGQIRSDGPPYFIAEIGLNHNGERELAVRLLEAAAAAGASAAKFQIFDPDFFLANDTKGEGSAYEIFRSLTLSESDWAFLKKRADELHIDFLASVFDLPSLELYKSLGAELVKFASGDLTNRLLIEQAVESRLGILLSSGMADDEEVARALSWIPSHIPVVLMQCVSAYPADPRDMNLRTLSRWRKVHTPLVGLSDHTMENEVSLGAIPLGAVVIERHFTLDREMAGPDQALSLEPDEFQSLVRSGNRLFEALGDGEKRPVDSERPARLSARRSLYWAHSLEEGHPISVTDLLPLRPGGGIDVADYRTLVGKRTTRRVNQKERILPEDFQGS